MRRPAILVLLAIALVLSAGACLADGNAGGTPAQWKQRRAAVLRAPGLLRFYTFEDVRAGASVANVAGEEGALGFSVAPLAGAPEEKLTVIEGRWPGKPAVRIDRGVFSAPAFAVGAQGFSVEMWFRKNGPGALRGNGGATNGALLSIGGGYWDGFRVTTSYPEQTFGFEIGRPQPASSVGFFGAGPLADGVWNHLAATWDGREMRLYLNGSLAGWTKYAGAFTQAAQFQIGYADAGWGSVKLDVDSVAVYGRALSEAEVLASSLPGAPLDVRTQTQLVETGRRARAGDWSGALAAVRAALAGARIPPDVLAYALLRAAECSRHLGKGADAARAYERICRMPGVAERFRAEALRALAGWMASGSDVVSPRVLQQIASSPAVGLRDRLAARLALAARYRLSGSPAAAARIEADVMKDPSLSASDRLAASLAAAHALRASGRYAEARAAYQRTARMPAAPEELKTYCALLSAHTWRAEGRLARARDAYRALLATPDLPSSHRLEAEESLRSVARLLAGKPEHDPADTRVALPASPKPAVELFVAPGGSDANPGTRVRPLATLAGAVQAVRRLRKRSGGIAVTFKGGVYPISRTVEMTSEDSGASGSPIVFRSAPGEKATFFGGVRVTGFGPVTDREALSRLPAEARGKALCADLAAQGITDTGRLWPHGVGFEPRPVAELYADGRPMTLARWPNHGWATTGKILAESTPDGGFAFEAEDDRLSRWVRATDAWLQGYFGYLWADCAVAIARIDPATHRIDTRQGSSYGVHSGMPYYAYNLLEELDAPGEWYLDRDAGKLYLIPPAPGASSSPRLPAFVLSVFSGPFVSMKDVSHVRFERLGFEYGRGDGIVIDGGDHVLLAGCTLARLGGTGVTIKGGWNHGVFGCDIATLGRNGTSIAGGDRKTLRPSGHFVENCHIHDFSRWDRTYTPAVFADGVGIRVAHNLIHDSPGHALRIEGNDHWIAFNEVHDVVYETDDQGALDMWFNPTYRGVVLRDNYWHHIGDGTDRRMHAGIRLDDAISGVLIYGNVFEKASEGYFGGLQIHGGKENVVDNNLFVDCKYGISFSRWGADRWRQYTQSPEYIRATTETVDISRPPYSTRYPALAHLTENPDVNMIWRNVAVNCGEFLTRDGGVERTMDNLTLVADPGFANAARRDYTLDARSPVFARSGFRPIPFREIGLYAHPLRASWPANHAVGTHGMK